MAGAMSIAIGDDYIRKKFDGTRDDDNLSAHRDSGNGAHARTLSFRMNDSKRCWSHKKTARSRIRSLLALAPRVGGEKTALYFGL
jgi:hypothetical protein